MNSPVIWNGQTAKNLLSALQLGANSTISSGDTDPSSVALLGSPGDVYISTSTYAIYVKQDSGTTTNWSTSESLTVGGFDSEVTPSVDGLTITGGQIIAQSASDSAVGMVNTGVQTFTGPKTF